MNMLLPWAAAPLAMVVGWGIVEILIAVIIIVAVVAIFLIFIRASGIAIPPWVMQIVWIVLAAFITIVAIRFVMTM